MSTKDLSSFMYPSVFDDSTSSLGKDVVESIEARKKSGKLAKSTLLEIDENGNALSPDESIDSRRPWQKSTTVDTDSNENGPLRPTTRRVSVSEESAELPREKLSVSPDDREISKKTWKSLRRRSVHSEKVDAYGPDRPGPPLRSKTKKNIRLADDADLTKSASPRRKPSVGNDAVSRRGLFLRSKSQKSVRLLDRSHETGANRKPTLGNNRMAHRAPRRGSLFVHNNSKNSSRQLDGKGSKSLPNSSSMCEKNVESGDPQLVPPKNRTDLITSKKKRSEGEGTDDLCHDHRLGKYSPPSPSSVRLQTKAAKHAKSDRDNDSFQTDHTDDDLSILAKSRAAIMNFDDAYDESEDNIGAEEMHDSISSIGRWKMLSNVAIGGHRLSKIAKIRQGKTGIAEASTQPKPLTLFTLFQWGLSCPIDEDETMKRDQRRNKLMNANHFRNSAKLDSQSTCATNPYLSCSDDERELGRVAVHVEKAGENCQLEHNFVSLASTSKEDDPLRFGAENACDGFHEHAGGSNQDTVVSAPGPGPRSSFEEEEEATDFSGDYNAHGIRRQSDDKITASCVSVTSQDLQEKHLNCLKRPSEASQDIPPKDSLTLGLDACDSNGGKPLAFTQEEERSNNSASLKSQTEKPLRCGDQNGDDKDYDSGPEERNTNPVRTVNSNQESQERMASSHDMGRRTTLERETLAEQEVLEQKDRCIGESDSATDKSSLLHSRGVSMSQQMQSRIEDDSESLGFDALPEDEVEFKYGNDYLAKMSESAMTLDDLPERIQDDNRCVFSPSVPDIHEGSASETSGDDVDKEVSGGQLNAELSSGTFKLGGLPEQKKDISGTKINVAVNPSEHGANENKDELEYQTNGDYLWKIRTNDSSATFNDSPERITDVKRSGTSAPFSPSVPDIVENVLSDSSNEPMDRGVDGSKLEPHVSEGEHRRVDTSKVKAEITSQVLAEPESDAHNAAHKKYDDVAAESSDKVTRASKATQNQQLSGIENPRIPISSLSDGAPFENEHSASKPWNSGRSLIAEKWRSAVDPSCGETYYYNKISKETTWERPPCFVRSKKQRYHENLNATPMHRTIPEEKSMSDLSVRTSEVECALKCDARNKKESSPWRSALDEASGRSYYYNKCTKETTWEMPHGFSEKALKKKRRS